MVLLEKHNGLRLLLSCTLVGLLAMIALVNFSRIPAFYCADMYSDMVYATEVWKHRSVFPEGWVFGNQFYVVATPVLAALFYGITGDAILAMSIASTVMALLVIASFLWMLAPVIPEVNDRLLACALFIMFPLLAGDVAVLFNGWQLLFTLCSYYACYAITAFLAFGLYVRQFQEQPKQSIFLLLAAAFLSFCTGIQSLRQTLIMAIPMVGISCCHCAWHFLRKERISRGVLLLTGVLTAANLCGVVVARLLAVEQVQIFGDLYLDWNFVQGVKDVVKNILGLFNMYHDRLPLVCFAIVVAVCVFFSHLFPGNKKYRLQEVVMSGLLCFSIAAVCAVDFLTGMNVRPIYYFMVYPLLAYWTVLFLRLPWFRKDWVRDLAAALLVIVCGLFCVHSISDTCHGLSADKNKAYTQVASDLLEQDITTIHSRWDVAQNVAIASNMRIEAGFSYGPSVPFLEILYLCNPDVFDNPDCAYLFVGSNEAEIALKLVEENGYEMTLLNYYPEIDFYIYTSDYDLMNLID